MSNSGCRGRLRYGGRVPPGIAACLELLALLQAHPEWAHPTIEFVATVGEEVGLIGSRELDVAKQAWHDWRLLQRLGRVAGPVSG